MPIPSTPVPGTPTPSAPIPVAIERELLLSALDEDAILNAVENVCTGHQLARQVVGDYLLALGHAGLITIYTYGGLENDEILPLPASSIPTSLAYLGYEVFLAATKNTVPRLDIIS
ncbi:hypothetical protein ACLBXM_20295 [Xanthobacteraceae bacterium A53D]